MYNNCLCLYRYMINEVGPTDCIYNLLTVMQSEVSLTLKDLPAGWVWLLKKTH